VRPRGVRPGGVRPRAPVRGRSGNHHHERDREHQRPGGGRQARPPGLLPAYHGRHLGYPVPGRPLLPRTLTV